MAEEVGHDEALPLLRRSEKAVYKESYHSLPGSLRQPFQFEVAAERPGLIAALIDPGPDPDRPLRGLVGQDLSERREENKERCELCDQEADPNDRCVGCRVALCEVCLDWGCPCATFLGWLPNGGWA